MDDKFNNISLLFFKVNVFVRSHHFVRRVQRRGKHTTLQRSAMTNTKNSVFLSNRWISMKIKNIKWRGKLWLLHSPWSGHWTSPIQHLLTVKYHANPKSVFGPQNFLTDMVSYIGTEHRLVHLYRYNNTTCMTFSISLLNIHWWTQRAVQIKKVTRWNLYIKTLNILSHPLLAWAPSPHRYQQGGR